MRFINLTIVFLLTWSFSFGQGILEPVKWSYQSKHVSGDEFDLIFTAKMDDNWTIYSQHIDDDVLGPIPTSFDFDPGDHFERVGEVDEKGKKKEGKDPLFDNLFVIKFVKSPVIFTQRVKVKDYNQPITGYLTFMTCDDKRCLPPTDKDFEFKLESAADKATGSATPEKSEEKQPKAEEKTTEKVVETLADKPSDPSFDLKTPVKWSFKKEKISDTEYALFFSAEMEKGWTIYSQLTSDDGPVPTAFEFEVGEHFTREGKVEELGKKKEGIDPFFDVNVIKFTESPVVFKQIVKVTDDSKPIKGFLTYMCCDDEQCLPPTDVDFSFALSAEAENVVVAPTTANISGDVIDQVRPEIQESYKSPVGDCGVEDVARDKSLIWTFILGFIGGLVALLTPCVFPMIPLTVSFFTKSSKDRASGIRNAIIYGLSIIVIYVAIGLLITGVFGEDALQQLSTDWIANTLFFVIFIFFAFSFFGYYELTLPSSWSNRTDSLADKGGFIGTFFMAFTLVIVSFSCTGPIIGSALVESATNKLGPFVVMLGFSTALALPFGLFAAFPGWLNSLPRSGSWMNSVKVVLGFLELALALKFLSVADMTMHWGILPYEVFMVLWVLIFGATAAYLFGLFKFPHDSPMRKLGAVRGFFALLFTALTIYLVTGFFIDKKTNSYNALGLMSGLAPPAYYNLLLAESEPDPTIKSKYPSFTKCANDIDCFKDYFEGIAYAKEVGKPVFLDFTGYGCVNCRKTEEHIWVEDKIRNKLQSDFVLVSLYTDDRKKLKKQLISKSRQTKLRNVGNKWADFQIVNFQQNSQPLYVMMAPDEKVLAAPRGFKEGVDDYSDFLDCGLKTFEEYTKDKKLGSRE